MELRLLPYLLAVSAGTVLSATLPSVPTASLPIQRVKVPYGPFYVPGVNEEPSMGMQAFIVEGASSPCPGAYANPPVGCLVLNAHAGLEFDSDGSAANANTGMWLHHVVIGNTGRKDALCEKWSERWFASGNERTPVDYTGNGTFKTGYELSATDSLYMQVELMNTSPHPRAVVLTVEFDVVPLPLVPADWNTTRITPVWLDVTGLCGNAEFDIPVGGDQVFNVATPEPAWKSTVAGDIVYVGGHLHDGGVDIKVLQNGKELCNSVATYGGNPAFIDGGTGMEGVVEHHHHDGEEGEGDDHEHEGGEEHEHEGGEEDEHEHAPEAPGPSPSHDDGGHGHGMPSSASPPPPAATTPAPSDHDHGGHSHRRRQHDHGGAGEPSKSPMSHISDMTTCRAAVKVAKGDELTLLARYDLGKHPAMAGHHGGAAGGLEPIMAIALVYVAVPISER